MQRDGGRIGKGNTRHDPFDILGPDRLEQGLVEPRADPRPLGSLLDIDGRLDRGDVGGARSERTGSGPAYHARISRDSHPEPVPSAKGMLPEPVPPVGEPDRRDLERGCRALDVVVVDTQDPVEISPLTGTYLDLWGGHFSDEGTRPIIALRRNF